MEPPASVPHRQPPRTETEDLAAQLHKLEDEIDRRDLEEIPASRLHGIAAQLRAEIARETGPLKFTESTRNIPQEEYGVDEHKWEG
jgi:hypothetical protein